MDWRNQVMHLTAIALVSLAAGCLLWRLLCYRFAIPWPSWLAWMLENPYMLVVAPSWKIVSRINPQAGARILDLGCGAGRIAVPLAQAVGPSGTVIGIDMQKAMLRKTTKRAQKYSINNLELQQQCLGATALAAQNIDCAVMVTILGEIPQRQAVVKQVFDCLKPGGTLSITEVLPDPCYQPRATLDRMCRSVGFEGSATFNGILAYTKNYIKPHTDKKMDPGKGIYHNPNPKVYEKC